MPRRCFVLLLALSASGFAASASIACPDHAAKSAASLTPSASGAALLAWKPRAWSPVATERSAAQGLRVSIDPVDGTMGMPGADELAASDVRIPDDAPVVTYRRANGSVRATLDDRYAEFAVVRLGADGKPAWTCVRGPQGAAQFLRTAAAPAPVRAPAAGTVWEDQ